MPLRIIVCLAYFLVLSPFVCSSAQQFPFNGEIDFTSRTVKLNFDYGKQTVFNVVVSGKSDQVYQFDLDIEELHTALFDISTQITGQLECAVNSQNNRRYLNGKLESQYTLIDKKPVREMSGKFLIENSVLTLNTIMFADLALSGVIGLNYPYTHDLSLILSSVPLDKFLNFWIKNKTFSSEGLLSGEIKAKGDVTQVSLRGSLDTYNGFIKTLPFDKIHLNIEGVYPQMVISNSMLSKAGGLSYIFQGPFDLSNNKGFKKQIEKLTIAPLIDESGSNLEWTIKRIENEDSSTTELKYLRRNEGNIGLDKVDTGGILGVEHKMKF